MSTTENAIQLPKPILIGAGILVLLGLFLASGDPGKKERAELSAAILAVQDKIERLEKMQTETQLQLSSQQESSQLLLRRLEVSEENNIRLRARVDEAERQLVAQRKAVAANAAKTQAKPVQTTSKPATNSKPTPKK